MPSRPIGDRKSVPLEDGVGLDQRGYVLTQGSTAGDTVDKADASNGDAFYGVAYRSTQDEQDEEVLTGVEAAVQLDGHVPVLCEDGVDYTPGDTQVYTSGTAGVANSDSATPADSELVGTVSSRVDSSDGDGSGTVLVPVNITGATHG